MDRGLTMAGWKRMLQHAKVLNCENRPKWQAFTMTAQGWLLVWKPRLRTCRGKQRFGWIMTARSPCGSRLTSCSKVENFLNEAVDAAPGATGGNDEDEEAASPRNRATAQHVVAEADSDTEGAQLHPAAGDGWMHVGRLTWTCSGYLRVDNNDDFAPLLVARHMREGRATGTRSRHPAPAPLPSPRQKSAMG
eukprot:scaffold14049_cov190-Isochrysis_galbana.AAC.1